MIPTLPADERNLVGRILENMKLKFGDFTPKFDSLSGTQLPLLHLCLSYSFHHTCFVFILIKRIAGVSSSQMMLIQPLVSTIVLGQLLSPLAVLAMSDVLFKRASLAANKHISSQT